MPPTGTTIEQYTLSATEHITNPRRKEGQHITEKSLLSRRNREKYPEWQKDAAEILAKYAFDHVRSKSLDGGAGICWLTFSRYQQPQRAYSGVRH